MTAKQKANEETEAEDDEDEVVEAIEKKIKPLWTRQKKTAEWSDGWESDGKLFYERVKQSLKSIDTEEWRGLWEEFWARERPKHIKGRKRMWKEVEREV